MVRRLTTDELIRNTREMLDEDNEANISDEAILDALNRAQDVASNILSRHYEDPLLASLEFTPNGTDTRFQIPEDALEERLEKVEVQISGYYAEVPRISYRDISNFESTTETSVPRAYCVIGSEYQLLPKPNGTYPIRVWYSKGPEPLVKCQGRIVGTGTDGSGRSYVTLDSIGSALSTESTDLGNYVNVIDGDSGRVKATLQIIAIDSTCDRVTFKQIPDRTSVLNKSVVGELPATVELDDYISNVQGSCVPILKKPNSNFIMQRSVLDIRANKLGEATEAIYRLDDQLMQQVERSWVGREKTLRVNGDNSNWSRMHRRRWRTTR